MGNVFEMVSQIFVPEGRLRKIFSHRQPLENYL